MHISPCLIIFCFLDSGDDGAPGWQGYRSLNGCIDEGGMAKLSTYPACYVSKKRDLYFVDALHV